MTTNFKKWAEQYKDQYSEYCVTELTNYEARENLYTMAKEFVATANISEYTDVLLQATFFVISATNVENSVFNEIPRDENLILFLASKVIKTNYEDAIPLFVIALGEITINKNEAENILLKTVENKEEYTSRMSLLSLAKLHSDKTESLAERAWNTGLQYQKIACLWALKEVNSNKLTHYLDLAHKDGQLFLVQNAIEIENESA